MAIRIRRETPFGVTLPNGYLRVVFFSGDATYVQYQVRTWATGQARQDEKAHVDERTFSFAYPPGGSGDIMTACYQHLKSLPEFSGGVDV